ncbi:MAG: hypothetical protein KKA73_07590 [Chloroflexi bacterium]|nr:hypothetical protein [Chloroflexota bacterium]MBU1747534.1 hypothetical protein [Chloroflexota bacterium]
MSLSDTYQRILTDPTPADLWQLQGDLLVIGTEAARQARQVTCDFCGYLRDLASKVSSRRHSRLGAILATASVTSVSLQELVDSQAALLERLLATGGTALLEIGSAYEHLQAWERETELVHCDVAWALYGELWDISMTMLPDLPADTRRAHLDGLLGPVVAPDTPTGVKVVLLIKLFQVVLAVRLAPVLAGES